MFWSILLCQIGVALILSNETLLLTKTLIIKTTGRLVRFIITHPTEKKKPQPFSSLKCGIYCSLHNRFIPIFYQEHRAFRFILGWSKTLLEKTDCLHEDGAMKNKSWTQGRNGEWSYPIFCVHVLVYMSLYTHRY